METINYQQKAIDFLDKHKIEFSTAFAGYRKHFVDDKEKRNTYECTFKKREYPIKTMSVMFGQSIVNTEKKKAPTAYDVITCLVKNNPGSFEDFCSEFGYDTDSRKAEKTYHAAYEEWMDVKSFFNRTEIEEMQEIN